MYDQVVKCQRAGLCLSEHFLISIAVASLGPLNETACQFLKDLGRRISAQSGDEREGALLFQRLSVVIQRFNAILLHNSLEAADHLG